jgi:hypothetical protein
MEITVLDGAKNIRLINFISIQEIAKFLKNIKFELQRYFNMNIMFNGLDWPAVWIFKIAI